MYTYLYIYGTMRIWMAGKLERNATTFAPRKALQVFA